MTFFDVLSMVGGLALFLYGMHIMGEGLSKASGGRLESFLEKLTSNRIKAVLVGAGVTAIIQSSSATTVMVVGFVNSGIMKLGQAVNRGQWDSAMMTLRRMDQKVKKLGIKEFEQPMKGLRLALSGRNELQTKQILAMVVAKRVRMREMLRQTK